MHEVTEMTIVEGRGRRLGYCPGFTCITRGNLILGARSYDFSAQSQPVLYAIDDHELAVHDQRAGRATGSASRVVYLSPLLNSP